MSERRKFSLSSFPTGTIVAGPNSDLNQSNPGPAFFSIQIRIPTPDSKSKWKTNISFFVKFELFFYLHDEDSNSRRSQDSKENNRFLETRSSCVFLFRWRTGSNPNLDLDLQQCDCTKNGTFCCWKNVTLSETHFSIIIPVFGAGIDSIIHDKNSKASGGW